MASKTCIASCMTLLRLMKGEPWEPEHLLMYRPVLEKFDDEFATRLVQHAADTMTWRPSRAELLQMASRLASPYPDAEETYDEILHKAQTLGLYAKPDPNRPNCYDEGPPNFSHPLVRQVVQMCGGWQLICTGEANYAEGLKKQVRAVHESAAKRWEEAVSKQLALPAEKRDPVLFGAYIPYRLPVGFMPLLESEPNGRYKDDTTPISAETREFLRGIGRQLPAIEPPSNGIESRVDSERRRQAAEEVREHRAAIERLRAEGVSEDEIDRQLRRMRELEV